ncbi:MAG: BatD family protein [Cellvibrionaceae bacterium]|nr:BatD family protein [Cellvibrionaceae bacterium]
MKNYANTTNKTLAEQLLYGLLLCLILAVSAAAQAQQLSATVNREQLAMNESLTLTLRYMGNSNASPDLQALNKDFEVLSQSQSSQYRNFNGRIESYTDWIITLMPLSEGKLIIPSISLAGAKTEAIDITVTEEKGSPAINDSPVFLETDLEKTELFVQEQVKITYRLYFSVNIESLDRGEFNLNNVLIEELPELKYRKQIGGRQYTVVEFSYALFPQSSGTLDIPSMNWDTRLNRSNRRDIYSFGAGRYQVKRLQTEQKQLRVLAKPDSFPAQATWLPSTALTLEETWSEDPANITTGEPLTRTITLKAEGLNSSQLPNITENSPISDQANALKFYPEQPRLNDEKSAYGVNSFRVEKYAVVANQAGSVTIPAIRLPWWDVENQQIKYAEIPSRSISVAAGAAANEPQISALPPALVAQDSSAAISGKVANSDSYWRALAYTSLCASLIFVGLWLHSRNQLQNLKLGTQERQNKRSQKRKLKESQAYNAVKQACDTHDVAQIRRAMLQWLAIVEDDKPAQSFAPYMQRLSNPQLKAELQKLDAALYGQSSETSSFQALLSALESFRAERKQAAGEAQANPDLPPLYS